jgi:hypothetical protein
MRIMNHIKHRPISNQMKERYAELRSKEKANNIDSLERLELDRLKKAVKFE